MIQLETGNQNQGDSQNDSKKLFVGGLSWDTTQESLRNYFNTYGEVVDAVIIKNFKTGRPRGFGFVTFVHPNCVAKVLSSGPHELDSRTIDPKACSTREPKMNKSESYPKVFLGGLPPSCTETDIRSFFSKYGKVMKVVIMYDQEKKKSRGFGFLAFEKEESVKQVCAKHFVIINNKQIECKRVGSQDTSSNTFRQHSFQNQWGSNPGGCSRAVSSAPRIKLDIPCSQERSFIDNVTLPSNEIVVGSYQDCWGPQQQSQCRHQGCWIPHQQTGWFCPSWGPFSNGNGSFSGPASQFCQQSYSSYGMNGHSGQVMEPDMETQSGLTKGGSESGPITTLGISSYIQEASNFGPTKEKMFLGNCAGHGTSCWPCNRPSWNSSRWRCRKCTSLSSV